MGLDGRLVPVASVSYDELCHHLLIVQYTADHLFVLLFSLTCLSCGG